MSNENETKTENKPAVREVRVVVDQGPLAYIWDTARFEHMFRIASSMAAATLIPDHLRRNKQGDLTPEQIRANCFRVVNQALRWGVDPWSIVDETFVVGGKLCFQGKVIAGLINSKAPINERLTKTYSGKEGEDSFTITIAGTFHGAPQPSTISMSVGYAKTENPLWRKNPRLKLWYSGVVQWAREFAPELVMGILTEDDAERIDLWKQEAPASVPQRSSTGPVRTEKPDFTPPKKAKAKVVEPVLTAEQAEAKRQGDEADREIEAALKEQAAEREEASKHDPKHEAGFPEFPWEDEAK